MKYLRPILIVLVLVAVIAGLPSSAKAAGLFPGYYSGIQIQNLDPADATASLVFYNNDGSIRETVPATIPGGQSLTFINLPLTDPSCLCQHQQQQFLRSRFLCRRLHGQHLSQLTLADEK